MIKRLLRKIFKRQKPKKITGRTKKAVSNAKVSKKPIVDKDSINANSYIPNRKITQMKWNGSNLSIQGYFYLEGIDLLGEDNVRKELILIRKMSTKAIRYNIPLKDKNTELMDLEDISSRYRWSGFEGNIDFSAFTPNNMPLPQGEYHLYLNIEIKRVGMDVLRKSITLGNVERFMKDGFHTGKMEFFSASRELKYNLLAKYDYDSKTLVIHSVKLKDLNPKEFNQVDKEKNDWISRFIKKYLFKFVYYMHWLSPVKANKVLFASDSRDHLSGNFEFVYNEMKRQNYDIDYRFILRSAVDKKKTLRDIIMLARELATSRYILLDDFYPMVYGLKIRRNTDLVQLWHAVGAFKTFGFSRLGRPGGPSPKSVNHRNYTLATVSSSNIRKHYAEGFGINLENVIATGIPRTDVFFDDEYRKNKIDEIHSEHPFLQGKKVILFAPTFRGNGQQSAYYNLDALDLDHLYNELKDDYIFIFKMHPFIKNDFSIPYMYKDFYYDFSEYREINDLLFVTDILITDYSSVCFEFSLLERPIIFFAYDVEEYIKSRDFYYEYNSFIPGPLAKTTQNIIDIIKYEQFEMNKLKPFRDYFFDDVDGYSSKRVVDYMFSDNSKFDNHNN